LKECLTGNMKARHRLKLTTCKQQLDLIESQIQLYPGRCRNFAASILAKKSAI
jgi:hypothetical protein